MTVHLMTKKSEEYPLVSHRMPLTVNSKHDLSDGEQSVKLQVQVEDNFLS